MTSVHIRFPVSWPSGAQFLPCLSAFFFLFSFFCAVSVQFKTSFCFFVFLFLQKGGGGAIIWVLYQIAFSLISSSPFPSLSVTSTRFLLLLLLLLFFPWADCCLALTQPLLLPFLTSPGMALSPQSLLSHKVRLIDSPFLLNLSSEIRISLCSGSIR